MVAWGWVERGNVHQRGDAGDAQAFGSSAAEEGAGHGMVGNDVPEFEDRLEGTVAETGIQWIGYGGEIRGHDQVVVSATRGSGG